MNWSKILFYIWILGLIVNGVFWVLIEYTGVGEDYRVNFLIRTILFVGLSYSSYKKIYGKD